MDGTEVGIEVGLVTLRQYMVMDMVGTTTIDGTITIMDTDGITMATVGTR